MSWIGWAVIASFAGCVLFTIVLGVIALSDKLPRRRKR